MNMKIQTYSGKLFDIENPSIDDIDINDIAHSLSMQCRFAGHTLDFYSVAEHSILCASIAMRMFSDEAHTPGGQKISLRRLLPILLHDASEAYITDIPTPIKQYFPKLNKLEKKLQSLIYEHFKINDWNIDNNLIKHIDGVILAMEKKRVLLHDIDWGWELPVPPRIDPMFLSPEVARLEFIKCFKEYSSEEL